MPPASPNQVDWEGAKAYVLGRLANELSPKLTYHSLQHTRDDVMPAAEKLACLVNLNAPDALLLYTAALYHDIGFVEEYTQNEIIGVRMAAETLPQFGYDSGQIRQIVELIMATQLPQTPKNFLEELICDADLDSLGRADFLTTSHALMQELVAYGQDLTLEEWYRRQLAFLQGHRFFTTAARSLREAGKQENIEELKRRLEALGELPPEIR